MSKDKTTSPKAIVNMSLQGKGGVGKSLVATLLTQYLQGKNIQPKCFDTDPINQTFAGYKALNVQKLRLGNTVDEINPRSFDALMEDFFSIKKDTTYVIDNGSGTYLPLISYMVENEVIDIMESAGHQMIFHAILAGGQAYNDTIEGLEKLFKYFPTTKCVIWLNEYFGAVEKDNLRFENSDLFNNNIDKIQAVVTLGQFRKETHGLDVQNMMERRQTFDEAITDPTNCIMTKQRLTTVRRSIFTAMEEAQL